jgi:hypothetical protein
MPPFSGYRLLRLFYFIFYLGIQSKMRVSVCSGVLILITEALVNPFYKISAQTVHAKHRLLPYPRRNFTRISVLESKAKA